LVTTSIRRCVAFVLLVGVVAAVSLGFSPNDSGSAGSVGSGTAASGTLFGVSQPGPDTVASGEAAAIVALGNTGAGPPLEHSGHLHTDPVAEVPLDPADTALFDSHLLTAQHAIPKIDSLEKAEALGYVRASSPGSGIGTHWVLWSQIAKPFDPAKPSMLLFDEKRKPAELVGYSYALQSPTRPDGFAGGNDHWHQHTGLCVKNGWVVREEATGPAACDGVFIAGGDFWMLHAWVVPGWENRKGRFATYNPKLCPRKEGTPDFMRCPE
jgi:hypothetical protein